MEGGEAAPGVANRVSLFYLLSSRTFPLRFVLRRPPIVVGMLSVGGPAK